MIGQDVKPEPESNNASAPSKLATMRGFWGTIMLMYRVSFATSAVGTREVHWHHLLQRVLAMLGA